MSNNIDGFDETKVEPETTEDIYDEKTRKEEVDNDEISDAEEGFMEGYEDDNLTECAYCHQMVRNKDCIEREINKVRYRFCCEDCYNKFLEKDE